MTHTFEIKDNFYLDGKPFQIILWWNTLFSCSSGILEGSSGKIKGDGMQYS